MSSPIYNVIFLCTGNSARSILAEAILNQIGRGRFKAFSAGSQPTGKVNPHALKLLTRLNFDTTFARSKSWDEFAGATAQKMDFVLTVCDNAAAEICPIWPGHPMTVHMGIPDPAAETGTEEEISKAFATAYKRLNDRITMFTGLPLSDLDTQSIQIYFEKFATNDHD
jgi:arsenate reductase (thioredoxin)